MHQRLAIKKLACPVLILVTALLLLSPMDKAGAAAVWRWSTVLDCVMLPVESGS